MKKRRKSPNKVILAKKINVICEHMGENKINKKDWLGHIVRQDFTEWKVKVIKRIWDKILIINYIIEIKIKKNQDY